MYIIAFGYKKKNNPARKRAKKNNLAPKLSEKNFLARKKIPSPPPPPREYQMDRALTCPSKTNTGPTFLYGDSDIPPQLVAFYDTLGIRRSHSRLNPRALTGDEGNDTIVNING